MTESQIEGNVSHSFDSPENKSLTTIIQGARIDLVGRVFNAIIRYGYVFLLARLLGADLLGIFFLGLIITEFFGVIARFGLDTGVVKYVAVAAGEKNKAKIKGVITSSLIFSVAAGIFISILLVFGSNSIANHVFHKPELSNVLKVMAISLPLSSATLILLSATQAFHTLKYRVTVEFFLNPILNLTLVALFFLIGYRLSGAVAAYVLTFVFSVVISLIFVKRLFPEIVMPQIKPVFETRKLLRFSTPLLLVNFLSLMMMWTDVLMLGYFKQASDVGIYNTAVRTAFFINFIIMSFTSIFTPRISELFSQKKLTELESLFKTVTRWIFTLSIPIFLIIVIFSKQILLLFGAKFVNGYVSLIILAIAHLVNASVGSVRYILVMSENERLVMYNTVTICILNILLNALLIPKFGMNGAAIATATSIILINIIMLIQVKLKLAIHPYNLRYYKPLVAGIVVFVGVVAVQSIFVFSHQLVFFAAGVLLIIIGYFLLVSLLGFDEHDRIILQMLKIRISR